MITIKLKDNHTNPMCHGCGMKNDTVSIRFMPNNTGTEITLCKECRKKLVELIKQVDE